MSVWICIPSIRPNGGTLSNWHKHGYRVAVLRQGDPLPFADIEMQTDRYLGWAPSINLLTREVLAQDSEAEWLVSGGDDTFPDPNHTPEEIARECSEHFACSFCDAGRGNVLPYCPECGLRYDPSREVPVGSTFGVMQPTGDKKAWPASAIENFAGSPWMGREWCQRAYQGQGPLWREYFHMFGDEELQCVAKKLGVFWQRPDLTHFHQHWMRNKEKAPEFLHYVNSPSHWESSKSLFNTRKSQGFPGHEPLGSSVDCGSVLASAR